MTGYSVQLTYNAYIDSLIPRWANPYNEMGNTLRYTFAATKEEAGI